MRLTRHQADGLQFLVLINELDIELARKLNLQAAKEICALGTSGSADGLIGAVPPQFGRSNTRWDYALAAFKMNEHSQMTPVEETAISREMNTAGICCLAQAISHYLMEEQVEFNLEALAVSVSFGLSSISHIQIQNFSDLPLLKSVNFVETLEINI